MDHHDLKLELNSNTNFRKHTNAWKLNNVHQNHQWVKEEIKKLKTSQNSMKMTARHNQIYGHNESSAKKKFIALLPR